MVTKEIAQIIEWDGTGVPPPPPAPPNVWHVSGLDFFGFVQRDCNRLNEAAEKQYQDDTELYRHIFKLKMAQRKL
jgi:hypothetical protein